MGLRTILGLRRAKVPAPSKPKKRSPEYLASFGFKPDTVIDIGVAGKGTPELYEAFPGASLLLVDPLPEGREVGEQLRSKGRRAHFVQVAAGAKAGTGFINRHAEDSKSSPT